MFFSLQVIVIQKYFRRWLAMRTVEKVRQDMAARLEWEREDEIRKRKEKEDRIRREFERRMNPKSREDFDLLYHALESMYNLPYSTRKYINTNISKLYILMIWT